MTEARSAIETGDALTVLKRMSLLPAVNKISVLAMPRCQLCRVQTSIYKCDWPVKDVPTRTRVDSIVVDDIILHGKTTKLRVCSIEEVSFGRRRIIRAEVFKRGLSKKFFSGGAATQPVLNEELFMVLRPGICGVVVCEACVREVDDKRHYCKEHWRAWQEVA